MLNQAANSYEAPVAPPRQLRNSFAEQAPSTPSRKQGLDHSTALYRINAVEYTPTYDAYEELFAKMIDAWKLTELAPKLLGAADPNHAQYVLAGLDSIVSIDEKARITELFAIFNITHSLMRNFEAEIEFMNHHQEELGASPFELLRQGSFQNIQRVRNFVEMISGF